MRAGIVVNVTQADRHRLEAIVSDRSAPQKHVWRANIILATAEGCGTAEIMRRSGRSKPVVWRWQARFMTEGVDGLTRDKTRKPGRQPLSTDTVQRVVDLALGPPPGEETHWTGRMLAKAAGVSLRSVQRILEAHQLAPHRIRMFKLSTDPKFADKLKDVAGLYVDPPAHAVVLSVDEKSQIQALDRTQPGLPMKPGRAGTMTHDYKRHGTTTLFAALNILDGTVISPQYAAPSPPGVHPLSNHYRAAGSRGKSDPCHRRQLCNPQASKGAPMAGAASPLDVPLHPDLSILAKRSRRLLRQAHAPAPQARRVPICR
jgi:transposase